jgi:predicted nucleic acid-binding protein
MIYLDANVIIRLIEGAAPIRAPIELRLAATRGVAAAWATSTLSRLECRCKPLKLSNAALLSIYDGLFIAVELVTLKIDDAVIEKATELRAGLNVKTPDAIHLASAIVAGASTFLTGDQNLARCQEVKVEIL